MPEMKSLSNANLLSKQSMGKCGKGKSCPHFGLFGKTSGSNKGPWHKLELQLIFVCCEVGESGLDFRPVTRTWWPHLSPSLLHTSQIITYLDFTLTAFLLQVKKSLSVWMSEREWVREGGKSEAVINSGEINMPLFNTCKKWLAVFIEVFLCR